MSARLPEVGERFIWCGATFIRLEGEIDDGMFPVRYIDVPCGKNSGLIGKDGLMGVSEDFRILPPSLEQKWDVLWPLACAVSSAVESLDSASPVDVDRREANLAHMARQLKKAVDRICPDDSLCSADSGEK